MTDVQFETLITELRNISNYTRFSYDLLCSITLILGMFLLLWVGFKILKPYLFRI